ncbi:thiolase family protein [Thermodesulfobacteriota bacterium]
MDKVYVIGAAMSDFGAFPNVDILETAKDAVWDAIKSAGIKPGDIDMIYSSATKQGSTFGQRALVKIGLTGGTIINVENACASGGTAVFCARNSIASGACDIVLVMGAEKLTGTAGFIPPMLNEYNGSNGYVMPAGGALIAKVHMATYGTTKEQMAKVSVKNHHYGCLNPRAQFKKEMTVEEILASPIVCDPVHLFECCPTSDGAAAVVLCSERVVKKYCSNPVELAASVVKSGYIKPRQDMSMSELSTRAASEAYEEAGIGPEDVDVAELHDPFTIMEIMHYENLGFCERGEGGKYIDEGRSEIGGDVAVNPSGGLQSKGHPLGATGVAQVAEIFWQLREEADKRQVPGAKVGIAHTMGGAVSGADGACSMQVLKI